MFIAVLYRGKCKNERFQVLLLVLLVKLESFFSIILQIYSNTRLMLIDDCLKILEGTKILTYQLFFFA